MWFVGCLRFRLKIIVWYYWYVGCYKLFILMCLGWFIGRMRGKMKVFECVWCVKRMGYCVFVLCNWGDCYVLRYLLIYFIKFRVFGCFMVSIGGLCVIDVYVIRKGKI